MALFVQIHMLDRRKGREVAIILRNRRDYRWGPCFLVGRLLPPSVRELEGRTENQSAHDFPDRFRYAKACACAAPGRLLLRAVLFAWDSRDWFWRVGLSEASS